MKPSTEPVEIKGRANIAPRRDDASLSDYVALLRPWWKSIVLLTLLAVVATALVSKFVLVKWYQSTAIVEPVPEFAVEDRMEGGLGFGSGASVTAMLGLTSGNDAQTQEFMAVLKSFAFSTAMVKRHHLEAHLLKYSSKPLATEREKEFEIYEILKYRFSVESSMKTGNMTLRYVDDDPIVAQRILGYYLADLRDMQRQEAIKGAAAAVASLENEAKTTGDSLLAHTLYQLIAKQVQRQKLAEVEADFAFKVIEPPFAPDKKYRPITVLNCLIALVLSPVLIGGVILLWTGSMDRRFFAALFGPARTVRRMGGEDAA